MKKKRAMSILGLIGEPARVEKEAERLWWEKEAVRIGADRAIRRAAAELYGLNDPEAFGEDCYIERLGATNRELFAGLAAFVGQRAIREGIMELIEICRGCCRIVVITGLGEDDRGFVEALGGELVEV